ncbi:MAG: FkbM family methyltransferase [Candidatus Micrarchaeota archaeon]
MLRRNPCQESFLGYRVRVLDYDVFYHLFREIFIKGEYRFSSNNRHPRIIDAGSNIGMSLLYFKYYYPDAEIIAFEPGKDAFKALQYNCRVNRLTKVRLYEYALGKKDGTLEFYTPKERWGGVTDTVIIGKGEKAKFDVYEVKSRRLSSFVKGRIDFMKMDIEGAELEVFAELAAENKLQRIANFTLEYHHHNHTSGAFLGNFLKILEANGFDYMLSARHYGAYEPGGTQVVMVYASRTKSK